MLVVLPRHLFGRRQHRLDAAEIDHHGARVVALLDGAGDDVTLAVEKVAEGDFVLGVAQTLQNLLLGCGGCDPAEPLRGVVPLAHDIAVLVDLLGPYGDVAGGAVELDASLGLRLFRTLVRQQQSAFERLDHERERDVLLALQRPQQ